MSLLQNGFTIPKIMELIEERNGFDVCIINSTCKYREYEYSCLMGVFIPDDKYDKKMEGSTAGNIIANYKLEKYIPFKPQTMNRLQELHDGKFIEGDIKHNKQLVINFLNNRVNETPKSCGQT